MRYCQQQPHAQSGGVCTGAEVQNALATEARQAGPRPGIEMGRRVFQCSARQFTGQLSKAAVVMLLIIASSSFSVPPTALLHATDGRLSAKAKSVKVRVNKRLALAASPAADGTPSALPPSLPPETQHYPTLKEYAVEHCVDFMRVYTGLLDYNTGAGNSVTKGHKDNVIGPHPGLHLYLFNNSLFINRGATAKVDLSTSHELQTLLQHLRYLRERAMLPDLAFLAQKRAGFSPSAGEDTAAASAPLMTLCSSSDPDKILFPHFCQHDQDARQEADANAPLQNGTGDAVMAEDKQPVIMHNRDSVWLPGSCRRNALSLNVPVFKADNTEPEWYYHLMRPFVHYIPFTVNNTDNNLNSMLRWANENSYAASVISQQANDFASFFLSSVGRECYALQLLYRLHKLGHGNFTLPVSAVNVSDCESLIHCPQL